MKRRTFLGLAAGGVAGAAGLAVYAGWFSSETKALVAWLTDNRSSFDKAVAIWHQRMRPQADLLPLALKHYVARGEANTRIQDGTASYGVDNDPAAWLAAFDQLRSAEFASGDFVYLDGWPFSKSEVALLRLAPSLN